MFKTFMEGNSQLVAVKQEGEGQQGSVHVCKPDPEPTDPASSLEPSEDAKKAVKIATLDVAQSQSGTPLAERRALWAKYMRTRHFAF